MPAQPAELETDILIVGGGTGGVAAALAACEAGARVILTEEYAWLGGQLTSQAVPPDEHPWIEAYGATASYRRFRWGVREYYRRHYPLRGEVRADPHLNPGQGWVSALCHEPRVAVAVIDGLLAPYRADGQLTILTHHTPVAAEVDGDEVRAVTLQDETTGERITISARCVLDATELGDLLPLAGVEHVTGAESQQETGEPHAVDGAAQPLDQQAFTWCFAMDLLPGEDHTIEKPAMYDCWAEHRASFWPGPQLGWRDVDPETLQSRELGLFARAGRHDFWRYRRILSTDLYSEGRYRSDVTLVNWPMIDYWLGPLVGVSEDDKARDLEAARQLSRSFLYWMQTDAPRPEGGYGYPGLRLRGDLLDGVNGLAKAPYIRESRRLRAEFTVLEQHVGVEARGSAGEAAQFPDSVGIGSYRIDLHPSTAPRTYVDVSSYPFQIPLGALIPERMENLLPAAKNLGVTHITNGCYRLHPVEWNIGEVAGALAAWSIAHATTPRAIRHCDDQLRDFQQHLTDERGIELGWPAELRRIAR
jgi:hypothetical protein